jgi:exodeoxyribonuclease-5
MTSPSWSPQQAEALTRVGAWLADPSGPQVFRLFGYAGTGKTTLAQHLAQHVRQPLFAAFTGKAASVLRNKGCPGATTLHSLLYNVQDRDRTKLNELDAQWPEINAEFQAERDRCKRPWFYVNPLSIVQFADLVVVDEVSMVDKRIGADLESFKKKILVLGDPAQLPPIQGGGYFTNAQPDVLLTEVHRQAAENPVLRWATMARKGEVIPYGLEGTSRKVPRSRVEDGWLANGAGQILCGKNETRRDLNTRIRRVLGFTSTYPVRKDVLVALQNDHKMGILNGTICSAACDADVEGDKIFLDILYERKHMRDLTASALPFQGKEAKFERGVLSFDFGYALTVHKSQGSQWPTVTIYDDGFGKRDPEVRRRWLYTAITRAEHTLHIVTS